MGLLLISAITMKFLGGILLAAAGLGFVIFVHELGHFAVARMCGVKCEKFMVGFDFGGLKLSRKWGETEYGIGVFPLGGYVKMLGQDDDPAKIAEQMEASKVDADSEFGKEIVGPDGKKRIVDRRSYQAKTVPQRMAIISAGVIMNMIFALIFAIIAFGMGVDYSPVVISHTSPGAPAWRSGLKPGDEIVQIGDRKEPGFDHLMSGVTLSDIESGVKFKVRRRGTDTVEDLTLYPEVLGGTPKIGVGFPFSNELHELKATVPGSAAAQASPAFEPKDQIIAVGGTPVESYADVMSELARRRSESLEIKVRRSAAVAEGNSAEEETEELTITVPAAKMRRLGMVMTMGPIAGIEQGSPAEKAGLKAGDKIIAIDGQPIGSAENGQRSLDPAMLDELFRESDQQRTLSVLRAKAAEDAQPEEISVTPRTVDWLEMAGESSPMPLPSLGLAYEVLPTVEATITGSAAANAGVQAGDVVTAVTFEKPKVDELEADEETIEFGDKNRGWPAVLTYLQNLRAGTKVKLALKRGAEKLEVELEPETVEDAYSVKRGFNYGPLTRKREVESFGDQVAQGVDRTWFSLTTVVRFLRKLAARQVPMDQLGGPGTIAKLSYQTAAQSIPTFLLFLTMLSANLAVLNFLPIPVLDGGHMVFLAWEGLTGKPANEKLTIALTLIGMALLLSLMAFVIKNDIVSFLS